MKTMRRISTSTLSALALLLFSAHLLQAQGLDEGGAKGEEPTDHQQQPQTPTGSGGQPSSGDSIGCCCCCPTQQAVVFSAIGLPYIIPSYPGCDHVTLTDPVVVTSGKLYVPYTDVEIPGLGRFNHINLAFIRSYNSRDNFNGVLGWGWVTNLDTNLSFSGSVASFKDGDGSRYFMQYKTSVVWADGHMPGAGWEHGPWTLEYVSSQSAYVLTKTFGTKWVFSSSSPYRLLRIEDRQGHQIIYNRDTAGKVTSLEDSAGQKLEFTYDATTGKLATMTDPLDREWVYTLTGSNLTSVVDPMNRETVYAYTATDIHNLTSIVDVHGRTISYTYDTSDRVSQVTNPDSTTRTFDYYPSTNESTITDEAGETWEFTFGSPGIVTDVTGPYVGTQPPTWHYEYNDQKKMTLMRDPKGREMTWEWDTRQNLTAVHGREAGASWTIETDSVHHFPLSVTDALEHVHPAPEYDGQMNVDSIMDIENGHTTYYSRNADGLTDTTTDRNGNERSFTWSDKGDLLTVTDATLRTTTFTYDLAGRRTSAQADGGPLYEWEYDAADRVTEIWRDSELIKEIVWEDDPHNVSVFDALGNWTNYYYDDGGRVGWVSGSGYTNYITYEYNARGQLWKVTDRAGRVVERLYGIAGRLWKVIEPDPAGGSSPVVTEYGYDVDGSLISLKDPAQAETIFDWDPEHLLKTTTFPDETTEVHEYDVKGRMIKFTNRAGVDRSKEYDALDRLSTQSCPSCGATFKYDNEGRLTFVDDAIAGDRDLVTVTDDFAFEYDEAGRLLCAKQPGPDNVPQDKSVQYTYDAAGRLETMTWPDGTVAEYGYDSKGRLETITRNPDTSPLTWTYAYNDDDTRDTVTLSNGVIGTYTYDDPRRLSGLTWKAGTTVLNSNTFLWTEGDQLYQHAQTNGASGTRTYQFDDIDRLKTSTPSGTLFSSEAVRTWNYDAAGNRTSVVTGTATVNYTLKSGEWNLYDTVNNVSMDYDGNKNLNSDGVLSMEYDADNRLTDLDKSGAFNQDLVYDWMGRIIKKAVTIGSTTTTTRYYYSGWTVLAEVNESGGSNIHRYVPGPAIDELLTDETGGTIYHALNDHLGSTTALVTGTSTSTATVTQRYTYGAYGTPTIRNSSGTPINSTPTTNYLYTGREYEPLSGLYNYRNRFYHPALGRFLQPDPIGFGGGKNFFSYVRNSPSMRTDPSGLIDAQIGVQGDVCIGAGVEAGAFIYMDLSRWYLGPLACGVGVFGGMEGGYNVGCGVYGGLVESSSGNYRCITGGSPQFSGTAFGNEPSDPGGLPKPAGVTAEYGPSFPPATASASAGKSFATPTLGDMLNPCRYGEMLADKMAENAIQPAALNKPSTREFLGNCFAKGTPIATPAGLTPIESLRVGQFVFVRDMPSGVILLSKISATHRGFTKEIIRIDVSDSQIETTEEHPFFVDGKGFVLAKYLEEGDRLLTIEHRLVQIRNIERSAKTDLVFNLTVDSCHNYFVGDRSVLVHNKLP